MRFSIVLSALALAASCAALPADAQALKPRPAPFPQPGRPGRSPFTPVSRQAATTSSAVSATASTPVTDVDASSAAASATASAAASNCLAGVTLPSAAQAGLPAPVDGASALVLVAQGQGTQNYTCANNTAAAIPASIGAVATLFNISCSGDFTQLGTVQEGEAAIGNHFFVDTTTPDFDIVGLGNTELTKTGTMTAPANTNGDVAWLQLTANTAGTTSSIKNIYRVLTSGGSAPATCDGQDSVVTVSYQAEYWFFT